LNKLNNERWFYVCYRNILEDPAEDSKNFKTRRAPKSRNRRSSASSSIEQLALAVEEVVWFLITLSYMKYNKQLYPKLCNKLKPMLLTPSS
jgi:hypothetical protein